MQTRRNTWQILALAATVAVVPILGCDSAASVADRKVADEAVSTPTAYAPEQATENVTKLDALSKEANLSIGRRAIAKAALAGAELDAARFAMGELQRKEVEITRTIWQMDQIAGQLRTIKSLVDSAKRRDPATPLAAAYQGETSVSQALAKKAQAARQGDEPWVKGENASSLGNAAATKKKIDETQGKIDQIKGQMDTLTKQRDTATADAAKAQQEADTAKGEEAHKAFVRGADLRKQAAVLSIQIEAAQASLLPLNQDLAALKAHEEKVNAAATAFDAAAKTYTDEYARVTKNVDDLTASGKAMLETDKASLKSKGADLAKLISEANALRGEVVMKLQSAEAHYADAVKESDSIKTSRKSDAASDSPEAMLTELATKTHEGASLRLRQAEALSLLAAVHSTNAALLTRQVQMQQYAGSSASPLGLSVPAEAVDGKAEDEAKNAKTSAEEAYTKADELLQNVSEGATGSEATRTAAKVQRVVVFAGRSYLAANTGDTETAKKQKEEARRIQAEVEQTVTDGGAAGGIKLPAYLSILTESVTRTPASSGATPPPATKPATTTPVETPATPVETPAPGAPVMGEK